MEIQQLFLLFVLAISLKIDLHDESVKVIFVGVFTAFFIEFE